METISSSGGGGGVRDISACSLKQMCERGVVLAVQYHDVIRVASAIGVCNSVILLKGVCFQ